MKSEIYSIGDVSRKTGLSTHIIRIWERRYQAIDPQRTPTKHRRYSDKEVQRLHLLKRLTDHKIRISKIATHADEELREILQKLERQQLEYFQSQETLVWYEQAQKDIQNMNMGGLKQTLSYALSTLSQVEIIEDVIAPLLNWIGQHWSDGSLSISQEHMASSAIQSFLNHLRENYSQKDSGPKILIATPSGQLHELGALMVAVIGAQVGWQVIYCGTQMPADEIANTATKLKADMVALSLVYPQGDILVQEELEKLGQLLSSQTKVVVGGAAAQSYESALHNLNPDFVSNLKSTREYLVEIKNSLI